MVDNAFRITSIPREPCLSLFYILISFSDPKGGCISVPLRPNNGIHTQDDYINDRLHIIEAKYDKTRGQHQTKSIQIPGTNKPLPPLLRNQKHEESYELPDSAERSFLKTVLQYFQGDGDTNVRPKPAASRSHIRMQVQKGERPLSKEQPASSFGTGEAPLLLDILRNSQHDFNSDKISKPNISTKYPPSKYYLSRPRDGNSTPQDAKHHTIVRSVRKLSTETNPQVDSAKPSTNDSTEENPGSGIIGTRPPSSFSNPSKEHQDGNTSLADSGSPANPMAGPMLANQPEDDQDPEKQQESPEPLSPPDDSGDGIPVNPNNSGSLLNTSSQLNQSSGGFSTLVQDTPEDLPDTPPQPDHLGGGRIPLAPYTSDDFSNTPSQPDQSGDGLPKLILDTPATLPNNPSQSRNRSLPLDPYTAGGLSNTPPGTPDNLPGTPSQPSQSGGGSSSSGPGTPDNPPSTPSQPSQSGGGSSPTGPGTPDNLPGTPSQPSQSGVGSTPTGPGTPDNLPGTPSQPSQSGGGSTPTGPGTPDNIPGTPSQPSQSGGGSSPTGPGTPDNLPGTPSQPSQPGGGSSPSGPGTPDNLPGTPSQPSQSGGGSTPTGPGTPDNIPGTPSQPSQSGGGSSPSGPGTPHNLPGTPSQPSQSGGGSSPSGPGTPDNPPGTQDSFPPPNPQNEDPPHDDDSEPPDITEPGWNPDEHAEDSMGVPSYVNINSGKYLVSISVNVLFCILYIMSAGVLVIQNQRHQLPWYLPA